ncbi:phage/plasmid primase, P4 family [Propionivibrio sp.]|uniref:phage/plasmid primase, P4 family n=1 Tax=Propionivibrio sp. TaxID=2212460 RepID=UPI003BF02D43
MKKDNLIFAASLEAAFESVSMAFPARPMSPGKFVRFGDGNKQGDKACFCKIFPDGTGATFGSNRQGTSYVWQQRDVDAPVPSQKDREALREKHAALRIQDEIDTAKRHAEAALRAESIWRESADLKPDHPYIVKKGITPYGAKLDKDGSIVIPIYGTDGEIQSLQFIRIDEQKRFLIGAKSKGGRFFIGEPVNGNLLIVAEGWATACSIHESTGATVVVAFSGSNMAVVAAALRRQYPDSEILIAGDLDSSGIGLRYATAGAAAGSPARVVLPAFADGRGSGDFNDLHQAENLDAVRYLLTDRPVQKQPLELAPYYAPLLPQVDSRDGTANSRPLTEYGNAQRLSDEYGENLRYCYDVLAWLQWGGASWTWDTGSQVRSMAASLPKSIYQEGVNHIADAPHFANWARVSQKLRTVSAAVSLLSDFAEIRLPMACIDADHFTVGFDQARQIINLKNGTTRPATQSDYVTKALTPASVGDASKAVRWIQFLDQVFDGDAELIDWLKRFCGYLLSGSTREQVFLFCHGFGANGKSVFIELLKFVMGDYARAIASETLSESKRQAGGATPDLASLIGARMVVCSETEDNQAMAESLVKSLVSGDSMSVRKLYCAPMEFQPNFKLLLSGNHKPVIRGNDNGIWRRVRLIPFNRTFSPKERDPDLLEKLKSEAPHILKWMIDGCIQWQAKSLADTPTVVQEATDSYRVDQDLTGRWLDECTSRSVQGEESTTDLYANYKTWSIDNGLRPASAVALGRRLSERGYVARKSHGKRFLSGLSLSDTRHNDYASAKGGY